MILGIVAGLLVLASGIFIVFAMSGWVLDRLTNTPDRWYDTPLWMAFGVGIAFPALIGVFVVATLTVGVVAEIPMPWERLLQ